MDNDFMDDDGLRQVRRRRRFQTALFFVVLLLFMDPRSSQPVDSNRSAYQWRVENVEAVRDTITKLEADLPHDPRGQPFSLKPAVFRGQWNKADPESLWTVVPPMAELPSKETRTTPGREDVDVVVDPNSIGPHEFTMRLLPHSRIVSTEGDESHISLVEGTFSLRKGVPTSKGTTFAGLYFHDFGRLTAVAGLALTSGEQLKVVWESHGGVDPTDPAENKNNNPEASAAAGAAGSAAAGTFTAQPNATADRFADPSISGVNITTSSTPIGSSYGAGGNDGEEAAGGARGRRRAERLLAYEGREAVVATAGGIAAAATTVELAGAELRTEERAASLTDGGQILGGSPGNPGSNKGRKRGEIRGREEQEQEDEEGGMLTRVVANLAEQLDELEARSSRHSSFSGWWSTDAEKDATAVSTTVGDWGTTSRQSERLLSPQEPEDVTGETAHGGNAAVANLGYFPAMVQPAVSVIVPGQMWGSIELQDVGRRSSTPEDNPGCMYLLNLKAEGPELRASTGNEDSEWRPTTLMKGELVGVNCDFWATLDIKPHSRGQSPALSYTVVFATVCLLQMCLLFCRVGIMLAQQRYGRTFMVPRRFQPPKFDYHRPLPPEWRTDQAIAGQDSEEGRDLENGLCPECAICYATLDPGLEDYMLTPCEHVFHQQCLTRWMGIKMECPTCRHELPPALD